MRVFGGSYVDAVDILLVIVCFDGTSNAGIFLLSEDRNYVKQNFFRSRSSSVLDSRGIISLIFIRRVGPETCIYRARSVVDGVYAIGGLGLDGEDLCNEGDL